MEIAELHEIPQKIVTLIKICRQHIGQLMGLVTISKIQHMVQQTQN